jgi:hypothetical protein
MSRIIIGNSRFRQVTEVGASRADLKTSVMFDDGDFFASAFQKRNANHKSFYVNDEDWIVATGTLIYKGEIAEKALELILKDFKLLSLRDLQREIWGHFIISIKTEDSLTIFGDVLGTYELYYATYKGEFIVSNDIASVVYVNPEASLKSSGVYLEFCAAGIGRSTILSGVNRLISSAEWLSYRDGKLSLENFNDNLLAIERLSISDVTFEECLNEYSDLIISYFSQLKLFDSIGLNFTGGLDGRLVLAALNHINIRPNLYYGVGNSRLVNTTNEDLEIVNRISQDYAFNLKLMNWCNDTNEISFEHDYENFICHGLSGHLYGGSINFHQSLGIRNFESRSTLFMGGFCPAFSNKEFHEKKYDSVDKIVREMIRGPLSSIAYKRSKFIKIEAYNEVFDFLSVNKLIDDNHNLQVDGDVARALSYVRAESELLNLFNEYDYYIAPFNTYQLLMPLLRIPIEYRKNRKFQLALVRKLDEKLFGYPLFSGLKNRIVDLDKAILLSDIKETYKDHETEDSSLKIIRYYYYKLRSNANNPYNDLDGLLYKNVIGQLKKSKARGDWYGWEMLNLRHARRLNFLFRIEEFLKRNYK